MKTISLTTDYGTTGYCAAKLRGAVHIHGHISVDMSHHISPFNTEEAAYVVRNAYKAFPLGTAHIITVEGQMPIPGRILAYCFDGYCFIAPDNGILTLIFDDLNPNMLREVALLAGESSFLRYAAAAAHWANELDFEAIGPLAEQYEERINLRPVVTADRIRGFVAYVDTYQNAVTNISEVLFEKCRQNRPFSVQFKRNDPITVISPHYAAVELGEALCRFNDNGMLEIAVNLGRATELLGIKKEDMVEVVFGQE